MTIPSRCRLALYCLVAGVLLLVAGGARAADIPTESHQGIGAPSEWSFTINAYAWLAGLDGRVRTLPPLPAVDVNIGIGTVLENLDGAIMGTAEARNGRFLVFTDIVASRISPDKSFKAFGYPANIGLESGAVIATGMGGYRLLDTSQFSLDLLGGARVFSLKNTIDLQTLPVSISYGKRESWVDGVVGGRAIYTLTDNWFMTVIGLGGGISSNYEWDVFGGLGYRFNERWGAFAGYRALKVDYRSGDFIYDALQHGPVLGAQMRF